VSLALSALSHLRDATDTITKQLDADAPARNNPSARNLRHYLAGNYTLASNSSGIVMSDILRTAQRLTVSPTRFFPFTPFTAPNPMPNTGVHRFIYALYTQPSRFDTAGFESVGMEAATQNWNVSWMPWMRCSLLCSIQADHNPHLSSPAGEHSLASAQPSVPPSSPLTLAPTEARGPARTALPPSGVERALRPAPRPPFSLPA